MRTSFSKLSIFALPLAALTACQDYEPFTEAEVAKTVYDRNYNQAFVVAFGEIDPEQNWGFDPMPICGVDYDGATRGSNTNSNQWVSDYHYEVPGPRGIEADANTLPWGWCAGDVTNYERAYVYWWFSTHQWPKTLTVNWNNFFIENVWGQPEHSRYYADGTSYGGQQFGMDDLNILIKGKTPFTSTTVAQTYIDSYEDAKQFVYNPSLNQGADYQTHSYEQANNYNSCGGAKEQVMYVYDVSTADFSYKLSFDNICHNNWTIQQINGNYYLAFDYWHDKGNQDYGVNEADGYYNDWILKLFSGEHKQDYYTRRIMCEDLGDTFDWDFNDVVFDITAFTMNGKYFAMVTLQAAGGTLPIYIGDMDHEAHSMFGVETNVPVNVNAPGNVKRPAVVYTIPLENSQLEYHDGKPYFRAENFPIYVPSRNGVEGAVSPNGGAIKVVELQAETGKAPQKFACPSNTYWMQERQHIEDGHPNFWTWVKNRNSGYSDQQTVEGETTAFTTYVAGSSSNPTDFTKLYADLGKPTSVSYFSVDANAFEASNEFVPWRQLWNEMVTNGGLNDSQYTEDRFCYKVPGSNDTSNALNRTFISQAPCIYETDGVDDDPIAFSPLVMDKILKGSYSNVGVGPFEKVWPASN